MKIAEDVRKYAAAQAISEEYALKKGVEEPSAEMSCHGARLHRLLRSNCAANPGKI
jgi:phosphomethylpyrimidine synthase